MKRRPCKQCNKNRQEKFFTGARGSICTDCQRKTRKRSTKAKRLWDTYGITIEEYEMILEYQHGTCAICGRTPRYMLDVDHDHQIEAELIAGGTDPRMAARMSVRGLLCKPCNRHLLPAAEDNPFVLQAACDYIHDPPAFVLIGAPLP